MLWRGPGRLGAETHVPVWMAASSRHEASSEHLPQWTLLQLTPARIWVYLEWCWRRLLRVLDCKEIQLISTRGNQPWMFMGRTEAEAPILWSPDAKSWLLEKTIMLGKIEGKRREWQRMRWLESIIDLMHMNLSKLWEIVKDRGAWLLLPMRSQSWTRLSD